MGLECASDMHQQWQQQNIFRSALPQLQTPRHRALDSAGVPNTSTDSLTTINPVNPDPKQVILFADYAPLHTFVLDLHGF